MAVWRTIFAKQLFGEKDPISLYINLMLLNAFPAFAFLFLMTAVIYFQSTVTGSVTDNSGVLPGATILEKGTNNGATSNFEGTFSLEVSSDSGELEISFLGYETVTVSFIENRYKKREVEKLRIVDRIFIRDSKVFRVNQWNGTVD